MAGQRHTRRRIAGVLAGTVAATLTCGAAWGDTERFSGRLSPGDEQLTTGEYFEDCNAVRVLGENHMHDAEQATELWQISHALTAEYLVEHSRPDWSEFENGLRRRNPDVG